MPWSPFSKKNQVSESAPKKTPDFSIKFGKERVAAESIVYYLPDQQVQQPKGQLFVDELQKFQNKFGEPHREDYKKNELIYCKVPIVRGAIDKHEDFVLGNGFTFKVENETLKEEIETYCKDINLEALLRTTVRYLCTYGNMYWEITGAKAETLSVLDPKYIFIKRNKFGLIEQFNQVFKKNIQQEVANASWDPKDIAFFSFNKIGESPYGSSLIESLAGTLEIKLNFEKDIARLLDRKANQPLHIQVGDIEHLATDDDTTAVQNSLQAMTNYNEYVTNHLVKMDVVKFEGIVDKFTMPLKHFEEQIFYATQVPAVLMGISNVPEGLAKSQMEAFELRIKSIQELIEKEIVNKIFARRWPGEQIDIIWGIPSEEDRQEEVTRLTALLQGTIQLDTNIRTAIQKKIAQLLELDIDIDTIVAPEQNSVDKVSHDTYASPKEENIEMTPAIMDYILEQSKLTPFRQSLQSRSFIKDSIKEAIGWDPHPLKTIILKQINTEHFADMPWLSDSQKEVLRNILRGAIKNELSIPAIRGKIEQRLGTAILKRLTDEYFDRNGSIPNKKAIEELKDQISSRAETIARTEILNASNKSAMKAYEASNVVEEWQFLTAEDERVDDEICSPLNLEKFPLGEGPIPPAKTHPNCRCTVIPVLRESAKLR